MTSTLQYINDQDFKEAWDEWWTMRKKKKASNTDRAKKRAINKLKELAGGNKALAIKILDRSSDGGWTDLYPLKEDFKISFSINR